MSQCSAIPSLSAYSITFLFIFGKVPGCAKDIGLILVFGKVPNSVLSPENNLLLVSSCVCTSRPITASYFSLLNILLSYENHFQLYKEKGRLERQPGINKHTRENFLEISFV